MKAQNKLYFLLALFSFATSANAWQVSTEKSSISFVSIKKNNIAESHGFTDFSGSIKDGEAIISIKPDSVDSRVPIRDKRMREFLFETGVYPSIEVSAKVDEIFSGLDSGVSVLTSLSANLRLHGVEKEITLNLRVSAISNSTIVVSTTQPVLIRAANYNMLDGITKLSSLVNGLPIAETVPVSFSLLLEK